MNPVYLRRNLLTEVQMKYVSLKAVSLMVGISCLAAANPPGRADLPYAIQRRPVPSTNAREIALHRTS